ncbi:MAG TPA: hypothetical protein VEK79_16365 [Thermoanaerobaculia bacterium]|nr:hypothetical protein [Thermoanaerobaculia bacterium]
MALRLLYWPVMNHRAALAAFALAGLMAAGCTGGTESKAADENMAEAAETTTTSTEPRANAQQALASINRSIPIYEGADFREDLTRRDEIMIRNRYGAGAKVYTLASDDSFPQVFHYYTTYLAQFRAFPAQDTYPSSQKNWRTLEVQLNQAMQDPFVPGNALDPNGQQVTLQIAETESEPKTVIRYIVTPHAATPAAPVATASNGAAADPVAR